MVESVKVITTDIKNPWINLALEEYFLINQSRGEATLFLWQNKDTVVIGRNQNPWTECNLNLMEEENIRLARRISGGGAVFHDDGNLNFSFILNRDSYNVERQCGVIINALKLLGIEAVMSGRNDITVNGSKFSGNAFCFRGKNGLHHGTILVNANKEKMARYLNVSREKIEAKGVSSVKSRVRNLCEVNRELTVDTVKKAVIKAFEDEYGSKGEHIYFSCNDKDIWPKDSKFREIITRNGSWEWNFGETPDFNISLKKRFNWGGVEIYFKVDNAVVQKADVYSDALCEEIILRLPELFAGTKFDGQELSNKLLKNKETFELEKDAQVKEQVLGDIASWLKDEL